MSPPAGYQVTLALRGVGAQPVGTRLARRGSVRSQLDTLAAFVSYSSRQQPSGYLSSYLVRMGHAVPSDLTLEPVVVTKEPNATLRERVNDGAETEEAEL